MVIYFQHESGKHLEKYRHIGEVNVHSYQHSCLSFYILVWIRCNSMESFLSGDDKGNQTDRGVDKVQFIISPNVIMDAARHRPRT